MLREGGNDCGQSAALNLDKSINNRTIKIGSTGEKEGPDEIH